VNSAIDFFSEMWLFLFFSSGVDDTRIGHPLFADRQPFSLYFFPPFFS